VSFPEVTVEPAMPSDAAAVRAIYAPIVESTAISFELEVPAVDEIAERIGTTTAAWPWLVARGGEKVLGYAYAGAFRTRPAYRWSVETSVYVDGGARRRGVGRVLYARLIEILRDQGFVNAFAGIALPNESSVALHERFGYRPVGVFPAAGYKLGRWHDVGWWHLALNLPVPDPPNPRSVAD
jgi:L-amino acid N-acyltransferase YncA